MLLKDKIIFIVEDNTLNRVVYQMALSLHGARVEYERWGQDAVRRLQSLQQVDLIILDLMLHKGISGYDIFEEIRSISKYDPIPIITVSAAEPAIALPKAQQMGFAGFIAKPIDDTLFPNQIARVIAGERVWYVGERYHTSGQ